MLNSNEDSSSPEQTDDKGDDQMENTPNSEDFFPPSNDANDKMKEDDGKSTRLTSPTKKRKINDEGED
jgi:hypothetical protein